MSTDSPAPAAETPAPARERILDAAGALFYRDGFRAVGVDRVIAEAGVAKATFYRHFPSKDDLIVAWLGRAEAALAAASPPAGTPDALSAWGRAMIAIARQERCLGCAWQVTAAEFADPAHPARAAALAMKRRLLDDLGARARAEGLADPDGAAERVFLLVEGVWAAVRMFGPRAPLAGAEAALDRLLA